jgi:hypothetical protein
MTNDMKFLLWCAFFATVALLFMHDADAQTPSRAKYATMLCQDSFNSNIEEVLDTSVRVTSTMNIGEVSPNVWVMNYNFNNGQFMQGYCVFSSNQLITPALDSILEAKELSRL